MDGAIKTNRRFPGYTTAELELKVLRHQEGRVTYPADQLAAIKAEIAARKSGASQVFVVPQVAGGIARPRIGRM